MSASRWFQSAGVREAWDRFYDLLASLGRTTTTLMLPLLTRLVQRFDPGPGGRRVMTLEDVVRQGESERGP